MHHDNRVAHHSHEVDVVGRQVKVEGQGSGRGGGRQAVAVVSSWCSLAGWNRHLW